MAHSADDAAQEAAALAKRIETLIARLAQQGVALELADDAPLPEKIDRLEAVIVETLAHGRQIQTVAQESDAALRHHDHMLQTFIEHLPSAVAMFDRDMRYLAVSQRWMADFRLGNRSIIGESHYTVFPEISDAWKAVHRRGLAGATERNDGEAFPRADGTVDWVRWEVTPWHHADGSIGGIVIYSEDITERKQAEEALRESEEWLNVTLRSIGDAVITCDCDGTVTFLNPVAVALTGWTPEEAVGQPTTRVFPIINEQTRKPAENLVARVLRENSIVALANHTALVTKNGREIPIEDSAAPITDDAGRVSGVVLVFHDVTAKRRAQEALRASNEKFTKAFAANPAAIALSRLRDGMILEVNETWLALFGYRRDEVIGNFALNLTYWPTPEDRARAVAELQAHGFYRNREQMLLTKSGKPICTLSSADLLTIADEAVILSTWLDITELKQAEDERERLLSEVERRAVESEATINAIADAVVIYNPEGQLVRINASAERLLGATCEQLGPDFPHLFRYLSLTKPDGSPFVYEETLSYRALHGETLRSIPQVVHRPDGSLLWVSVSAAPIYMPDGAILGAITTFTDVTALHELQESERRYLYTVAHDLRAPTTIINGHVRLLLEMLATSGQDAPFRAQIAAVQRAITRMNRMIDNLTEITRFAAEAVAVKSEPVALAPYLDNLFEQCAGVLDTRRITRDVPPELPPVSADSRQLERILLNLLTNAQKYSAPDTPIRLSARRQNGEVVIAVRDEGQGIPPDDLPHIFERFYRAEHGRKAEGIGLGLYITKALVEAHGGRIWAESDAGNGSTFYFTLPVA